MRAISSVSWPGLARSPTSCCSQHAPSAAGVFRTLLVTSYRVGRAVRSIRLIVCGAKLVASPLPAARAAGPSGSVGPQARRHSMKKIC